MTDWNCAENGHIYMDSYECFQCGEVYEPTEDEREALTRRFAKGGIVSRGQALFIEATAGDQLFPPGWPHA